MARKTFEVSFNISGRLASTFRATFSSASAQLNNLKNAAKDLKQSLRTLESEYKKGAISTAQYQAAHARLTQQLEQTQRAQERLIATQKRQQELQRNISDTKSQMLDTAAMAAPFVFAAKSAMDFETAMLGVAKQAEGARDENGKLTSVYYEMRKQIQMLGREIPIANTEIAKMVESGLRMGVAKEQVIDFTRETAKMATAFDSTPEVIAEQMGKIANVMGIPIKNIKNLGDTINYLDDKSLAKGMDIIEVLQRSGGIFKQVGMNEHQAAALASTFLSLGKTPEVAATATNALIRELAIAEQQPKRFQNALKELGMTAKEVNKGMVTDAQGTILKILDKLNSLDKEKQTAVTTGLFGKEYGDDIATLAGGIKEYRRQLALLNEEGRKGSMDREFSARMQTTAAQLEITKNSVNELATNLGTVLLPPLNRALDKLAKLSQAAADFAEKYPNVTSVLVTGSAALVTARLGWLGLKFAIDSVKMAGNGVRTLFAKGGAGAAAKAANTKAKGASAATKAANASPKSNANLVNNAKVVYLADSKKAKNVSAAGKAVEQVAKSSGKLAKAGQVLSKTWKFVGKVAGKAALPLTLAAEAYTVYKSKDKVKATAQAAGGLAGGWGGAKLGAAIGTAIAPGIGTAIGGLIGGIGGYFAGKWLAGKATDTVRSASSAKSASTSTNAGNSNINSNAVNQRINSLTSTIALAEQNFRVLTMYVGQASGKIVGAIFPLSQSAQLASHNMSLLTMYTGQAIGRIVGSLFPLSQNAQLASHNMSLLTMYTGQAIGRIVGSIFPLAQNAQLAAHNMSLLTMYAGQASGKIVGGIFPIATHGARASNNLSLLAMYAGKACGWIASIFGIQASANMAKSNMSLLASYIGRASGWVASIHGIQSAASSVKSALHNLASRINSTKVPSISMSVGNVKKYARGGILRTPHVGMVAEEGPESWIPIKRGDNRALSLWRETGRLLGADSLASKAEQLPAAGSSNIYITYAPTIQGVEKREIEPVLKRDRNNFERQLQDFYRKKRRVSFT
jgi:TP901 family phage tail tape measure protein